MRAGKAGSRPPASRPAGCLFPLPSTSAASCLNPGSNAQGRDHAHCSLADTDIVPQIVQAGCWRVMLHAVCGHKPNWPNAGTNQAIEVRLKPPSPTKQARAFKSALKGLRRSRATACGDLLCHCRRVLLAGGHSLSVVVSHYGFHGKCPRCD